MKVRFMVGDLVNFRYRPHGSPRLLTTTGRIVRRFIINHKDPSLNVWIVSPIGTRDEYTVDEPDIWKELGPAEVPPPLQEPAPQNKGVGSESDRPEAPTLFQGNCPPGTKDDGGKETFRYIPFSSLAEVNKVLAYGAHKYAPDNWQKVDDGKMRYWDAAMRHLTAWKEEGPRDTGPKGSGLRHLAHAATCCLFAIWFEMKEEREAKEQSDGSKQ